MQTRASNVEAPPRIAPIADDRPRPLWSVMIPVRNRLDFLEQTLRSVLEQAPGPQQMQIEVVDNSSGNVGVEEFVKRIAADRVNYFRQPCDLPMASNWNSCVERARGQLIHLLHDDDYVAPGFYSTVDIYQKQYLDVGLFSCRTFVIARNGEIEYLSTRISAFENPSWDPSPLFYANALLTPSMVARRKVYETQGGFRPSLKFVADWDMWLRGIHDCGILMINQALAYYRVHEASITSALNASSVDLWEIANASRGWQQQFAGYSKRQMRKSLVKTAATQCRQFTDASDYGAAKSRVNFVKQFGNISDRLIFRLYQIWAALNRAPDSRS
jgi:glycosyltransferase involved in cell wall biosynthesis